jgi:type III secretion protein L
VALAVLTLDPSRRLAADSVVLPAARWQALQDAAQVVAAAEQAVADASAAAAAQARARADEHLAQKERQMQQALLLKALSLQVEYERQRQELLALFVQTQMNSLRALLAGPLPAGFFARVQASAKQWVGDQAALVLHAGLAQAAAAALAAGAEATAEHGPVTLVVDPELAAGQCHLHTAFGRLQASLDAQLEALQEAMQQWWQPARPAA